MLTWPSVSSVVTAASGRQRCATTTPGSTSSRPSKKRMASRWERPRPGLDGADFHQTPRVVSQWKQGVQA